MSLPGLKVDKPYFVVSSNTLNVNSVMVKNYIVKSHMCMCTGIRQIHTHIDSL